MEITLHCDRLRRGADEWMDVTDKSDMLLFSPFLRHPIPIGADWPWIGNTGTDR